MTTQTERLEAIRELVDRISKNEPYAAASPFSYPVVKDILNAGKELLAMINEADANMAALRGQLVWARKVANRNFNHAKKAEAKLELERRMHERTTEHWLGLKAQLTRVCEWHEVSCYDELPFVIDELREGETALNGEDDG